MNCQRTQSLMDAYSTGELDLAASLDVECHLRACPACEGAMEDLKTLRQTMAAAPLRHAAPPALRDRIARDFQVNDRAARAPRFGAPRFRPRGLALAAAIAALLLLPWMTLYWTASRPGGSQLAAEVTSNHIRSLMGDHLLDVVSTDQHTVKPWFNGKLDFSPPVVDPSADGFPLLGGRLEYINGRAVAAIVYRRRQHLVNVYTWPAGGEAAHPGLSTHNGYNVLTWSHDGMICVAASDLNARELRQLADLLTAAPAPPAHPSTAP